jgi:hypothetical protein
VNSFGIGVFSRKGAKAQSSEHWETKPVSVKSPLCELGGLARDHPNPGEEITSRKELKVCRGKKPSLITFILLHS